MFNDIEELMKEIKLFKTNIKDSSHLCELLSEISLQIRSSAESNDERSKKLINKHVEIVEQQKADSDVKYSGLITSFSNSLESGKLQQVAFETKSTEILNRLNDLEIEVLLKEIRKVNTKIMFLFAGIGIAIILVLVALFT